jgi:hypothetical protein
MGGKGSGAVGLFRILVVVLFYFLCLIFKVGVRINLDGNTNCITGSIPVLILLHHNLCNPRSLKGNRNRRRC